MYLTETACGGSASDLVSVCGATFTLPIGSSAMLKDGALHVTLPPGYKFEGKSSVGEPLFAYNPYDAQTTEETIIYCLCRQNTHPDMDGGCEVWRVENPDGLIKYGCDSLCCSICALVEEKNDPKDDQ